MHLLKAMKWDSSGEDGELVGVSDGSEKGRRLKVAVERKRTVPVFCYSFAELCGTFDEKKSKTSRRKVDECNVWRLL